MKTFLRTVTVMILLAALAISSSRALAQDDEIQPLDDKFVGALVAMAVNDNLMEGENEVRDLKALHSFVSDYYDDRIAADPNSTGAQWLNLQKKLLTSKLEEKINLQFGRTMIQTMLTLFTDADMMDMAQARQVVSGSDNPPPDYFSAINANTLKDPQAMIDLILEIDTVTALPNTAPSISNNSSWSHDVSAISSSTPSMRVAGDAQPVVSFGDGDSVSSGASSGSLTKPVRFDNTGFEPVTVKVASYTPAAGYGAGTPSASTVVSPDSNSSAYLELPPGKYTFCYEWQLDQDTNNDDYFDYHHRTTKSVNLKETASDNPNQAVTVTLNPDSTVSNPNGKCGKAAAKSAENLTPEEAANAGSRTYVITCSGPEWCEGESDIANAEVSFSSGKVTLIDRDADTRPMVLTRIGQNKYRWTNEIGDVWTITFSKQGFTYYSATGEATFLYTLQDGDTAPVTPSGGTGIDSGLTPAEAAVTGTHNYSVTSPQVPNDPEAFNTYTITFSPGSAVIQDTNGHYYIFGINEVYVEKIGKNLYSYSMFGDEQTGTVTFTGKGFKTTWSDGLTIIRTLRD